MEIFVFFVLGAVLTSVQTDTEQVVAYLGDDWILPSGLPAGEEVKVLEWFRPDLGDDGYLVFYREHRVYHHYQHEYFKKRLHFNTSTMTVTLKDVGLQDSGSYRCHYKTTNTQGSRSIQLTVTDTVRAEPLKTNEASESLKGEVQTETTDEKAGAEATERRYIFSAAAGAAGAAGAGFVLCAAVWAVIVVKRRENTEKSKETNTTEQESLNV